MNYMGIDYHRQYSHITLLDENGEVLKSGRLANFRLEDNKFIFCFVGRRCADEPILPLPMVREYRTWQGELSSKAENSTKRAGKPSGGSKVPEMA